MLITRCTGYPRGQIRHLKPRLLSSISGGFVTSQTLHSSSRVSLLLPSSSKNFLFSTLKSNRLTTSSFKESQAKFLSSSGSIFAMAAQPEPTAVNSASEKFTRLPQTAVPTHYVLRLQPDLEKFTFEGTETVVLEIKETSPTLIMNSAELTVSNIEWEDAATKKIQKAKNFVFNEEDEVLKVSFDPALPVGKGALKIKFAGILNDQMKGFYRSKYKGPNGEDRYNAVTQFESTDARRCFPCWDEPAVKSTFDVTLAVPKDRVALSNMPVKNTTFDSNLQVVEFETTPIMSTYLLAFCIGEFDYLEDRSADGVLCRVYTSVGKKEQGRFALDITTRVLPFYKEYFGIAYPLPKMDLIAIADFCQGAMENWGLITYRETCLLIDETESTATNRQWVALVVGHEIAHQWFGNLVTMEWWTHLWLNEGYASFVEFLCVDHLFPEYDIWTQFVTDSHNRALELDCLNSSHAIEVPVYHPSEIQEIFDDISYSKGSAIIRMLHNFIGDKDFRKGMNIYLNRHKYGNTFTEDLWAALEEASSKPVGAVMSTWTKQMGFPVIKVHEVSHEGSRRTFSLTQEKFWADPALRNRESVNHADYHWMVPLAFSSSAAPTKTLHSTLMEKKTMSVTLDDVAVGDWVKLNPGVFGFYRVQYPEHMLSQFLPAIRNKSMPPLDRLGLLDDLFAMVQSGQSSTVGVLNLLQAFVHEDNYTVWASISNIVGKLNLLMAYSTNHDAFKAFGRDLFSDVLERTGWEKKENENHLQTMLRSLVLNRMSTFGDEKTLKEANKRFALHVSGEKMIPADLRSAVYKSALAIGNEETFKTMLKMYRDADIQEEKDRISRSLGAIKDVQTLRKVLEFAISDDVRSQDTVTFFLSVGMGSKHGRDLAWDFFKENRALFQKRYAASPMVSRLVKYVTENFCTEERALEVEAFFKEHSFYSTERTVQQATESIRLNEAWLKRDIDAINNYLTQRLLK